MSPYPIKRIGAKCFISPKILLSSKLKGVPVGDIVGVEVEYMHSRSPYPFCGHGHILEGKSLDSACGFQPERGEPLVGGHEPFVEIADDGRHDKEHGILVHEGFGQTVPPETVVHVVKYSLRRSTLVVESDDIIRRTPKVVGKDAAAGVFSFPKATLIVKSSLALNGKAIRLSLPFLHEDGVGLKLHIIDDTPFPSFQREHVVMEGGTSVGADIEMLVSVPGVILLRLNELMVEIHVVGLAGLKLPARQQTVQQQIVHAPCRIEVIGLATV